jgi:hypothetical protein
VGGTVERATLATTELGNPASLGFVNMGGVLPHLGRLPRVSQGAEDDDRNPRFPSAMSPRCWDRTWTPLRASCRFGDSGFL